MIWQMDLLLILSEKERMADGKEVKREHLEGDREDGCVKASGVRQYRRLVLSAGNTHNLAEMSICVRKECSIKKQNVPFLDSF